MHRETPPIIRTRLVAWASVAARPCSAQEGLSEMGPGIDPRPWKPTPKEGHPPRCLHHSRVSRLPTAYCLLTSGVC